jgi:hypothetical protein
MKNLYYVVRPQLIQFDNDIPECNGWKYVTVFNIVDNVPIEVVNLEVQYTEDSIHNIEQYFSEYLPKYSNYELVQL